MLFLIEFFFPPLSFERRGADVVRRQMDAMDMAPGAPEKNLKTVMHLCRSIFGWHLAATARSFSFLGFVRKAIRRRGKDRDRRFMDILNRVSEARIDPYVKDLDGLKGGAAAETREAVIAFLAKYGHRSENEFELSSPSWREEPAHLLQALQSPAGKKDERPEGDLSFFDRILSRRLADSIMLREEMKSMLVKAYRQFRACYLSRAEILLRAGAIEKAEDIFFLTMEEIETGLRGELREPPPVQERKDAYYTAGRESYPDTFIGDFAWAGGSPSKGKDTLFGVSCAGGRAAGRAVLLDSPDEGEKLRPGDILVARSVDPGWTPLFSRAGGIVTEIGGMLSHAATVAREYGIPYVAGVTGVKERIKSGAALTVDGDNGMVYIQGRP
jgi:pyruvate,water dikinase